MALPAGQLLAPVLIETHRSLPAVERTLVSFAATVPGGVTDVSGALPFRFVTQREFLNRQIEIVRSKPTPGTGLLASYQRLLSEATDDVASVKQAPFRPSRLSSSSTSPAVCAAVRRAPAFWSRASRPEP